MPPPPDPDFESRVRASFAQQGVMRTIGAELLAVQAGAVSIAFSHRGELSQQNGFVHGGIVAAVLDSAAGYAADTLSPAGSGVLTIEFKVNLLAPAEGPRFRCDGRIVKAGRTITVAEAECWQLPPPGAAPDAPPRRVATLTATLMTLVVAPRGGAGSTPVPSP